MTTVQVKKDLPLKRIKCAVQEEARRLADKFTPSHSQSGRASYSLR